MALAPGFFEQSLLVHVNQSSVCDPQHPIVLSFALEPLDINPRLLFVLIIAPAVVVTAAVMLFVFLRRRWRLAHGQPEYPEIEQLVSGAPAAEAVVSPSHTGASYSSV
jgi:hypothetical protein